MADLPQLPPGYTLPWLQGYSGQTTEQLIDLEGSFRTDSIVLAFEQALDQKASARASDLSEAEWIVLAVEALEREVNNGGFWQFFANSSSLFAPFVAEALEGIGRADIALIARRAAKLLSDEELSDSDAIAQAAADLGDERRSALDSCDQQYFRDAGDLAPDVLTFIKQERTKIVLPGPA